MNINFIDSQLFYITGKLVSCMVSIFIVFQYFDKKYVREYNKKRIYAGWMILCGFLNFLIYLFDEPALNVCFWFAAILLTSRFFYYYENLSKKKYYIINLIFILAISTCESIGGVTVRTIISLLEVNQNEYIISFIYTIGGSLVAILLYYLILQRLLIGKKVNHVSVAQYTIYAIITVYILVNIGEILLLVRHELSNKEYLFLLADAVFMIFINLYLFYLLDTFAENRDLKFKLDLYERQAKSNYEYYVKQIESHRTALRVIHDIRKHIGVLEELKQINAPSEVQSYADSFEDMVAPLLIKQYCENAILNIILNDKINYCEKNDIQFDIDIQEISIEFMKPIDITTLFGNLLDNAVEACERAQEKRISLKVHPFNGFTYIQISNTFSGEIKRDVNGRLISNKGRHHGIGLENVEKVLKQYNGSIEFLIENKTFMAEAMFS